MGHKLTGDQLRKFVKRLGEIQRQIGQAEYPHDPEKALAALQALDEGRFPDSNSRVFNELLAACKQNWVNSDFNENNFPLEPVASDESEWEVYEHHFNQTVNGLDAFRKLEELGYRLCGPRRAMEYIVNGHLDIQLDHPLIVTARWQYSLGRWCAPILHRHYGRRRLHLCRLVDGFDPYFGWLVLRRKQS